jgi:CBS domain-containing protein
MFVKDYIIKDYPVLKSFDTATGALAAMERLKARHLPVVSKGIYRCLLSCKDLPAMDPQAMIGEEPTHFAPSIGEAKHLHEAVAKLVRHNLGFLPVVSPEGKYLGVVTRARMLEELSNLCHSDAPGSVLVIETLPKDYALSDIARVTEAHNAHVLSLLSSIDSLTGCTVTTLKIDLEDPTPVVRSFERFNYTVLHCSGETGIDNDSLRDKINEAMYYMQM